MMGPTVVDRLYREFQDIVDSLEEMEVSLRVSAEETFRKALLLTAASYFERQVTGHIMRLVRQHSSEEIVEFVRNKAVERQYHTYFQWDRHSANSFFGLFGEGYKSHMTGRVEADDAYRQAIRAFLELGNERNRLVHQDFGAFRLEKTSTEIFELYETARPFVDSLEASFDEYRKSTSPPMDAKSAAT